MRYVVVSMFLVCSIFLLFSCKNRTATPSASHVQDSESVDQPLEFTCENYPEQAQIIASVVEVTPSERKPGCHVKLSIEQSWQHVLCPYKFNGGAKPQEIMHTPDACPAVNSQASGVLLKGKDGEVILDGSFTKPNQEGSNNSNGPTIKEDFSCKNYPEQAQVIGSVVKVAPQGQTNCMVTIVVEKSWDHQLCPFSFSGGSTPEETFFYPQKCPSVGEQASGVLMKDTDGWIILDGSINKV